MKLLVSHLTALRYWRAATELEVEVAKPSYITTTRGSVASVKDAKLLAPADHGLVVNDEAPCDVLVHDTANRRPAATLMPHVWSAPVPTGAFLSISDGIYVSTPEFVYIQMAGLLDEVECARLGNELCGNYNLRRYGHFTQRTKALTSKAKMANMVNRAKHCYGATKALAGLRWVSDGSRSPQETNVLLALCLPRRMGGMGLPLPKLNPQINLGGRLASYVKEGKYYPDLMWERRIQGKIVRVVVEYDSHEHHDEELDAEHTRIRRNEFKTVGMMVTSMNRSQMKDAESFMKAGRQVARDLGLWRKTPSMEQESACQKLLDKLANETVF